MLNNDKIYKIISCIVRIKYVCKLPIDRKMIEVLKVYNIIIFKLSLIVL